jgi:2-keto-3-deoxy-L-rhamnonate aldolase RhmA
MTEHLKIKLRHRQLCIGTFFKTPSLQIAEALARSNLDLICLDGEHSPFDRLSMDSILALTRALKKSVIVRIPALRPEYILSALDSGASGILAPHVTCREDAEQLVAWCQFTPGGRGFAGATRAAEFGNRSIEEHLKKTPSEISVIAMIEDLEALENLDAIFTCPGIDAFFIGRADLTVALGEQSITSPKVVDTLHQIVTTANHYGVTLGMFTNTETDAAAWAKQGVSLFLMRSDLYFVTQGANDLVSGISDNL